jgi:hypothetical protein
VFQVARLIIFFIVFLRSSFVFKSLWFSHCIVSPSLIYGFWLPLWYLQTFLFLLHYIQCLNIIKIKRSLHDIFHIGLGISPQISYQARQRNWRADMGRRLIPGTIWKMSCHNLFITYFTLTFSKHLLLYCRQDLWTDKLRN